MSDEHESANEQSDLHEDGLIDDEAEESNGEEEEEDEE